METWGHVFQVLPPTGDHEPLTEDTDFLGSKKDAQWLCKLLGKESTELVLANEWDNSPNTGIAYIQRPDGRILMIDFLRAVYGLKDQEVTQTAVPIAVAGVSLYVMHPLLCLKSRLANLVGLESKRTTNGRMQAVWAVSIVGAWIRSMLHANQEAKVLIKACHSVAEIAEFGPGPKCLLEYGIDPLLAVGDDVVSAIGGRFVTDDWRRKMDRIRLKRLVHSTRYSFKVSSPPLGAAKSANPSADLGR